VQLALPAIVASCAMMWDCINSACVQIKVPSQTNAHTFYAHQLSRVAGKIHTKHIHQITPV
jgi:hypothetical protein